MRILMMTNTYLPHVGGVAHSVESFTSAYRSQGHRVVVVAPTFEDMPEHEVDVVRVPAIEQINGTDFSWRLPIPGFLSTALDRCTPEIVHSHHPFLLGDTALRVAAARSVPVVFTWHTMYEKYVHYLVSDTELFQRFMMQMAVRYANLCDAVIAPSESIRAIIRDRGVESPVHVIPTGIDVERFAAGDGHRFRDRRNIPRDAFVIGHTGRLAPEKNLSLLAAAAADCLEQLGERAWFLVVGEGPSSDAIREVFASKNLADRLVAPGTLKGSELVDAYAAMDVFAFASLTETQGMVLAEAMAAGVPVVAVSAPGADEVVSDGRNGILVRRADASILAHALLRLASAPAETREQMSSLARKRARELSIERCAEQALQLYHAVIASPRNRDTAWTEHRSHMLRQVETEWNLWSTRVEAAISALLGR